MENIKASLFDVLKVPLHGSNLIEASAGTGKTFSITILVLRLLLRHYGNSKNEAEKDQPIYINQILMVTFTTAAVAELESRIRKYVYIAEKYASAPQDDRLAIRQEHPMIADIVDEALQNAAGELPVQQTLKDNLLLLDEANIMTIHSFCQAILNEFAIETNQLFGVELYTDTDKLVDMELNKFWRKYITGLDSRIIRTMDLQKKRAALKEVVQYHLNGKPYAFYHAEKNYRNIGFDQLWQTIHARLIEEKESALAEMENLFKELPVRDCIEVSKAVRKSKEKYLAVLDDLSAFMEVYRADDSKVKEALPDGLRSSLDDFILKYRDITLHTQQLFFVEMNNLAIQEITKGYTAYLSSNNYVTYEDLIDRLYKAVYSPSSEKLKEKLNEKYKAVFVDEFQDTDKKQYDIFFETFSAKGILFLIGDPKQSIYGWRKADMLTYFKAREQVRNVYHMNINYRSSKVAIDAMNRFFKPCPDFDAFFYQNEKARIDYTPVDAPLDSGKGCLAYAKVPSNGMTLMELSTKSEIAGQVARLTLQLLADENYSLEERRIEPSDIGIVVRTNQQAAQIKSVLSKKNIPAVVVNEEKVLLSEEAVDVLYLLHAVWTPSLSKINRFLLSGLVDFGYKKLLRLDDNKALDTFQELNAIWTEDGVYPMLVKFATMFRMEDRWMQKAEGERKLTNFFHITELLNQMEKKKNYTPHELVVWLQRSIDGEEHAGDEYELRMESDENAVRIVTVHKSKGLEYNIVLAPFLDLSSSIAPGQPFVQLYDHGTQRYVTKEPFLLTEMEMKNYLTEQERENRRLVYVAVTRAAYQLYVFHSKREKNTGLAAFYESMDSAYIDHQSAENVIETDILRYQNKKASPYVNILEAKHFDLKEKDWHKLSFTRLSYHGERPVIARTKEFKNTYDAFVFDQLKFGSTSGNLLHSLLEEIDFSSDQKHDSIAKSVLQRYLPNEMETVLPNIRLFLDHVLQVPIQVGDASFQLKEIPHYKRLSELEFDFPVQDFDYKILPFLWKEAYPVQTRYFDSSKLQGLMNGKIDLFLEHGGKYYILDWKSNYLGFRLEDYNREGLSRAMSENNYHLQYMLYIVAAKKMLESRLTYFNYEKQFGGVIYLFLRGIRKDSGSGIFTVKPPYKTIMSLERLLC